MSFVILVCMSYPLQDGASQSQETESDKPRTKHRVDLVF